MDSFGGGDDVVSPVGVSLSVASAGDSSDVASRGLS